MDSDIGEHMNFSSDGGVADPKEGEAAARAVTAVEKALHNVSRQLYSFSHRCTRRLVHLLFCLALCFCTAHTAATRV